MGWSETTRSFGAVSRCISSAAPDELGPLVGDVQRHAALLLDVAGGEHHGERADRERAVARADRQRAERDRGGNGERHRQGEQVVVVKGVVVGEERRRDRRPGPEGPECSDPAAPEQQDGGDQSGDDEPRERRAPVEEGRQLVPLVDDVGRVAGVAVVDDDALPQLAQDVAVGEREDQPDEGRAGECRPERAGSPGPLPEEQQQERRDREDGVRLHRDREREDRARRDREPNGRAAPEPPRRTRTPAARV